MPGFQVSVPHHLSQEQAVERLKSFSDHLQRRYAGQVQDLTGDWVGNVLNVSFKVMGFAIGAVLTVQDSQATINGQLPLAAYPFKGQVEKSIKEELSKALA